MCRLILPLILVVFAGCSEAISDSTKIKDFDSCVAAGNKVLRSYPAKCVAPGLGTFTQIVSPRAEIKKADPLYAERICKDLCGDGTCSEIVCLAQGCPCPESKDSCSKDCK